MTDTGPFTRVSHGTLPLAGAHRQGVLSGLPASVCVSLVFAALEGPAVPLGLGLY